LVSIDEFYDTSSSTTTDDIRGLAIRITEDPGTHDFFLAISPGEVGLYMHAFIDEFGNIEEDYFLISENAELMEQIRKAAE